MEKFKEKIKEKIEFCFSGFFLSEILKYQAVYYISGEKMGLNEFNERIKEIRNEIKARGINLKSEKLEYEIAREIAKHWDTLKQYDIIQILNEISDNLDSTLNVSENLTIAKQIIDKYLGTNKYNEDYVDSYMEALEHWNNQYANELNQQYVEKEAENSVEWNNILKPQEIPKTKPIVETNNVNQSNKTTAQTQKPIVKVIKYKPDLSEIKALNERVATLETFMGNINTTLTQFMDMVNNNNNANKELIQKISNIENGISSLRQDLNAYRQENEALKALIAQLQKRIAELEQAQNALKERQDQTEIALNNILLAEMRELKYLMLTQARAEYRPTVKNNRRTTVNQQNQQGQPRPRRSKYDLLLNEIIDIKKDVAELKTKVDNLEKKTAQLQLQPQTTQQANNSKINAWRKRILKTALAFAPHAKQAQKAKEMLKKIEEEEKQAQLQVAVNVSAQ